MLGILILIDDDLNFQYDMLSEDIKWIFEHKVNQNEKVSVTIATNNPLSRYMHELMIHFKFQLYIGDEGVIREQIENNEINRVLYYTKQWGALSSAPVWIDDLLSHIYMSHSTIDCDKRFVPIKERI